MEQLLGLKGTIGDMDMEIERQNLHVLQAIPVLSCSFSPDIIPFFL